MEQLNQIEVRRVRAKVLLEDQIYGGFEHEGVIDSNHAHAGLTVPARFSSSSDTRVHDIIADKKEGLQEFRQPAQRGRQAEFFVI
jgi:hypothetical protein